MASKRRLYSESNFHRLLALARRNIGLFSNDKNIACISIAEEGSPVKITYFKLPN